MARNAYREDAMTAVNQFQKEDRSISFKSMPHDAKIMLHTVLVTIDEAVAYEDGSDHYPVRPVTKGSDITDHLDHSLFSNLLGEKCVRIDKRHEARKILRVFHQLLTKLGTNRDELLALGKELRDAKKPNPRNDDAKDAASRACSGDGGATTSGDA